MCGVVVCVRFVYFFLEVSVSMVEGEFRMRDIREGYSRVVLEDYRVVYLVF